MQRLILLSEAAHRSLLPPGHDRAEISGRLSRLLTEATGPETASLFAATRPEEGGIAFLAPPGRVARFADLDNEGREALRAEIGRLVSELRRAAERAAARDPAAADLVAIVAAAIEVPSFEAVFAHEGRPILAGWAMTSPDAPAGQRLLARLDDGVPAYLPARRTPWAALGIGLAALTLLTGGSVAGSPWIARWIAPAAPACRVDPDSLDALKRLLTEQQREQELRGRLAELQVNLGQRRLACPIPVALPASPEPPQPPPPPPPSRAPEPPPPAPTPQPSAPALEPPKTPQPPPQPAPPPPHPPAPPPRPVPPPPPPPNTEPCNQETRSGGRGITRTRHFLGPKPGRVELNYDTFREPDEIRVYYRGHIVAETGGPVSFTGSRSFNWNPPAGSSTEEQVVDVEVIGTGATTLWKYNLGCPR